MEARKPRFSLATWIPVAVVVLLIGIVWLTADWWRRPLAMFLDPALVAKEAEEEHAAHGGEVNSLPLSPQARANIGLTPDKIVPIALGPFEKTITIPAIVAERPGRTRLEIAAPMTGVVTAIDVRRGEYVASGHLLFRMRLTHEDLVQAQTEFLRTLGELRVEQQEIDRLTRVTNSGAVAGKVLLEREYAKQKLEAVLRANRQSLLLHKLTPEQIHSIEQTGNLVSEVEIAVPFVHEDLSIHDPSEAAWREDRPADVEPVTFSQPPADSPSESPSDPDGHARAASFVVAELNVHTGEAVAAGQSLCVLSDYRELYIQGRAFEQDAEQLLRAVEQDWLVDAAFETRSSGREIVADLPIVYLAGEVDAESRTYPFYVAIENDIVRTSERGDHRFVTWRYKPGQRVNLDVPVETWTDQIVLPVEAVADEGAESYVFVQNGKNFERRPVHVEYRGQRQVVIANDGSLYLGERVATTAAHQMLMAIKNAAGGGVDPHAGHNH